MRYLSIVLLLIFTSALSQAQGASEDQLLYTYTTDDGEGRISMMSQADGSIETLLSFPDQSVQCFWASADGSVLAYGLVDNQADDISAQPMTYYVDDLNDDTPRFMYENLQVRNCPEWALDGQSFALIDGNTFKYGVYGQPTLMSIQSFESDVTQSADGTLTGNSIHWSPQISGGVLLSVDLFGDIYAFDMTLNLQQITNTPDVIERVVSWSDTGAFFVIQTRATLQPEENIYMAIYSTVFDNMWRVTDDLGGTNIAEPIGWLADNATYLFRLQSDDAIYYAANANTGNLTSNSQSPSVPVTGVNIMPDGETLVYASDIDRSEDNSTYSFELMRRPIGGTSLLGDDFTYDGDYVQSLYALSVLPNRDDVIITLQRENEQFSSILFDADNRDFTLIFDTEAGAFYSAPMIHPSDCGNYLSYQTQTNHQIFGSDSEHRIVIVTVDTGERVQLVTQTHNWDNPYPRPILQWVSE